MKFVCSLCDAEYHRDHVREWGKHQESLHNGPRPVCTALVRDALGSGAVCRGDLVPVPASAAAVAALKRPTPIAL